MDEKTLITNSPNGDLIRHTVSLVDKKYEPSFETEMLSGANLKLNFLQVVVHGTERHLQREINFQLCDQPQNPTILGSKHETFHRVYRST